MRSLPRFGMGAAEIGNLYAAVSESDALAAVMTAWDLGHRYFDTAPYYGFGLSETRLGSALAQCDPKQSALVSTKVGRTLRPSTSAARERHGFVDAPALEPVFDYGRDAILRSHEQSLQRLGRDRINILLVHDLGTVTHGAQADHHMRIFLAEGYGALAELRSSGAIDMIGIGVNETAVCEHLLHEVDLDVILLAGRFTLLDQSAAEAVIPACRSHDVQFIAAAPYNSGILARSNPASADPKFDYEAAPGAIVRKAELIERICEKHGVPLPVAALQYAGRHPHVSCVLAGMARPQELQDHHSRLVAQVPEALWEELDAEGLARNFAADAGGTT